MFFVKLIMKKKNLIYTGLLIVILSFIFFNKEENKHPENQNEIISNLHQNISKRVFNSSMKLTKRDSITYEGKAFLIFLNKEKFWLLDNYSNKIVSYSKNLEFKESIGVRGESPSEHQSIKNADFIEKGYYTFDFEQQMIKKFTPKKNIDSLNYYMSFRDNDLWISDCTSIGEDIFLTANSNDFDFNFSIYNIKQKKIISKIDIVPIIKQLYPLYNIPEKGRDIIFEGYFSKSPNDKIIYSCNKIGAVFLFTEKGEFIKAFKTIDELGVPKFKLKNVGNGIKMHTLEPDFYGNYSRAINNDFIFILSNILSEKYSENRILDVYNPKEGDYLFSYLLDNLKDGQKPDQIVADEKYLYVLFENSSINRYEITYKK